MFLCRLFVTYNIIDVQDTFLNVRNWIKFVDNYSIPNIPKMLIGNKCDKRYNKRRKDSVDYKRAKVSVTVHAYSHSAVLCFY